MADEHQHDHDHDHSHDHDHDHDGIQPTVKVDDVGPARKKITIEVPGEQIAERLDENFKNLQAEASIPGFRRGRAPLRLLQKRFGTDVRNEVCNQVVGESYAHAVETHNLRVLGDPDIKDVEELELPDEGPLVFEAQVEVVPDFELPEMKDIEVEKPVFEVADDQIDAEIDRYREMYGRFEGVDKAEFGDFITAGVKVLDKDGEVVQELPAAQALVPGESRDYKGAIGGIIVEKLGKTLEGKGVGDDVTIETTGPAQHEVESIREQPIKIEAHVSKIERMQPMPLEELIEAIGMEKEDELKDQVRERLEAQAQQQQQQAMSGQVVDALVERISMDLPEDLSARQAERALHRRRIEMMYQGASEQDIEQQLAEMRAATKEQAQRELKVSFILDAVAREFDVNVTEAEVNTQIVQIAMQQGRRPERMREEMMKSGQIDQLFVQLREAKAVERVLEDVKIKEVTEAEWRKSQGIEDEGEGEGDKKPANKTKKKKTTKKKSTKKKSTKKKADD